MREANPDTDTEGQPEHYAHFDDATFILSPVPDTTYTMELHYKYRPLGISSTNSNTWLGDNIPQALLYGCLVEAYTFMKGEQDVMQMYLGRYQEALTQAKVLGEYSDRRDGYRNGNPVYRPS